MRHAFEVRFLLPFPALGRGVNHHRTVGHELAQFLDHPHALDVRKFDIHNAGGKEPVVQQRFGILEIEPVNDPVSLRIQPRPNCLGHFRMLRQNEHRFHWKVNSNLCP